MTTIDYSDNTVIRATAKLIGFPINDETEVFRTRDAIDFAYWNYAKNITGYTKLEHYRSTDLQFDVWMGFAYPIDTIIVYVPTEAAS